MESGKSSLAPPITLDRSVVGPTDGSGQGYLSLWLFFQIAAGNILLPILVLTFLLAKSVKRHPTLINMCITWILAGISSSMLFYAGRERGPEPSKTLCIAQSSLLMGLPPMASLSAFAVVYTVWSSIAFASRIDSLKGRFGMYILLVIPYAAWMSFAVATAVYASRSPERVNRARRFFYCSFEFPPLSNAMAAFTAAVCFVSLALEIYIAVLLLRNLRTIRNAKCKHPAWPALDFQLAGRLFVFSGFLVIALVFSAVSILSPRTVVPDIFAASIGMAVFLVFGTQSDVLHAWAFWLPPRSATPDLASPYTTTVIGTGFTGGGQSPTGPRYYQQQQHSVHVLDSAFEFDTTTGGFPRSPAVASTRSPRSAGGGGGFGFGFSRSPRSPQSVGSATRTEKGATGTGGGGGNAASGGDGAPREKRRSLSRSRKSKKRVSEAASVASAVTVIRRPEDAFRSV